MSAAEPVEGKPVVVLELPLTDELVRDTFDVALGAVRHWARAATVDVHGIPALELRVDDEHVEALPRMLQGQRRYTLGPARLAHAFTWACSAPELNADVRSAARTAVLEGDGAEVDAELADVLVQRAVFGDVVFS